MRKLDRSHSNSSYNRAVFDFVLNRRGRLRRARRASVFVCCVSILGTMCAIGLPAGVAEAAPSVWSVKATPHSGGATNLDGVSCVSSIFCAAVGSKGEVGTLVEIWNGSSWSVSPSPSPGGDPDELFGVSCVSSSFCAAVGWYYDESTGVYRTLIEVWNGLQWSIASSPSPSIQNVLFGVSCTSSSSCTAVGYDDGESGFVTLVESWNGTDWSIATRHPTVVTVERPR